MAKPPNCKSLGRHCRELKITIRVSDTDTESRTLQDASMTWITGHTERMTFGEPYVVDTELRVDATVHVPCKYLRSKGDKHAIRPDGRPVKSLRKRGAKVVCSAHRFEGKLPTGTREPDDRPMRRLGSDEFSIFYKRKNRRIKLRIKREKQRSLPVLESDNPCIGAPCITGDNVQGAACCRDLQLELFLPKKRRHKLALLKARRSPYLCKVKREDEDTVGCEVISACGYLDDDGVSCVLHDRILPNGRRAKPSLCYEWPDLEENETGHTGCRLL